VFVRLKLAGALTPEALAVTTYDPACPFAVSAGAVASPFVFVTATAVADPPNAAPAPVPGAVNVTLTPLTAFAPFKTRACNAVPNCVFTPALCGVPATALMFTPGTRFVKKKLAAEPTPLALAETT
jgi:hypothetical protein